jgi:hypothetical protein
MADDAPHPPATEPPVGLTGAILDLVARARRIGHATPVTARVSAADAPAVDRARLARAGVAVRVDPDAPAGRVHVDFAEPPPEPPITDAERLDWLAARGLLIAGTSLAPGAFYWNAAERDLRAALDARIRAPRAALTHSRIFQRGLGSLP